MTAPTTRAELRHQMIDDVVDELFIGPNCLRIMMTGISPQPVPTISKAVAEEYATQVVDRLLAALDTFATVCPHAATDAMCDACFEGNDDDTRYQALDRGIAASPFAPERGGGNEQAG